MFEKGNQLAKGRKNEKPWQRILMQECKEGRYAKLKQAAKALITKASQGDVPAVKELGDRIDGKVPQAVMGSVEGEIEVKFKW